MIPHEIIEIFSQLWWQTNIITIAIIVGMIYFCRQLNDENNQLFSKIIGIILISRVFVYHSYMITTGVWTVESSLPLQMCGITSILEKSICV